MFTRRSVLVAPLALTLARGCAAPQMPPPTMAAAGPGFRKRVSVTSAEARPHLQALSSAIRKMQDPKAPQLLSWENQREIHAGQWRHHWTWRFLPWHRAQLQCFEDIVRHFSGYADYAQPYWDPNDHKKIPAIFFDRNSPLYHGGRSEELRGLDFTKEFDRLVAEGDFSYAGLGGFDFLGLAGKADEPGAIDAGIHGLVHVTIGGDMGSPETAPLDPLFWFHHCNIDRMWATWQAETGAYTADKYPEEFIQESFDGIFATVTGEPYKGQARDYVDHRDVLAYDHAYAAQIIVRGPQGEPKGAPPPVTEAPPPPPPPPPPPIELELISETTKVFASHAASVAHVGTAAAVTVPIAAAFRPLDTPERRVEVVRVTGRVRIAGSMMTEGAIRVFLAEPGYAGKLEIGDGRFAELVALFGAFHHMGEAHFSLDLTAQYWAAFSRGAKESVTLLVELMRLGNEASSELTVAEVDLAVTARTFAAK